MSMYINMYVSTHHLSLHIPVCTYKYIPIYSPPFFLADLLFSRSNTQLVKEAFSPSAKASAFKDMRLDIATSKSARRISIYY